MSESKTVYVLFDVITLNTGALDIVSRALPGEPNVTQKELYGGRLVAVEVPVPDAAHALFKQKEEFNERSNKKKEQWVDENTNPDKHLVDTPQGVKSVPNADPAPAPAYDAEEAALIAEKQEKEKTERAVAALMEKDAAERAKDNPDSNIPPLTEEEATKIVLDTVNEEAPNEEAPIE